MNSRKKILVTGANGQLGKSFHQIQTEFPGFQLEFHDRSTLDISNRNDIDKIQVINPDAIINAAAYTAVDLAETNFISAFKTNVISTIFLAKKCNDLNIPFIHISSDYVYDNDLNRPLLESDPCKPKSKYADTKFIGESLALYYNPKTIIIRTSWVYSEHGNNFVKTILRLAKDRPEINVVNDQIGAPTYASDLAGISLKILNKIFLEPGYIYGIYNYSNLGSISWYDFAREIVLLSGLKCKVNPIPTSEYPRPAPRPSYSVFNLEKIKSTFGIEPIPWQKSLKICLENLQQKER